MLFINKRKIYRERKIYCMSFVVRKVFFIIYNVQKENKYKRKLYFHEENSPVSSYF